MTPEQFLQRVAKGSIAPVYLFLGQEGYGRRRCKRALTDALIPGEERADGLTQVDLEEATVAEVLDNARALSLFVQKRLIWVTSAELALPRRMGTASADEGDETRDAGVPGLLANYLKAPTEGTVVVFECSRYDFVGDDRPKMDRVTKFYSGIRDAVEFRPYPPEALRSLAADLSRQLSIKLGPAELSLLTESVDGDANRLALEFEKLALYLQPGQAATTQDIRALMPSAAGASIFALVGSLGKRDRGGALRSLDILIREGEYLPLALTFLSTQFRLALAAKENGVGTAQQAQGFFAKLGVRMWRERAEQVVGTASAFTVPSLNRALSLIHETDKKFREGYRDDRVVMETLVFALTA